MKTRLPLLIVSIFISFYLVGCASTSVSRIPLPTTKRVNTFPVVDDFSSTTSVSKAPLPIAKEINTFSVVDDFSPKTNTETSIWSYRYSADLIRDGSYQLLENYGKNVGWEPAKLHWFSNHWSGVGVNKSGISVKFIDNPNTFTWKSHTVWLHPPNSGLVVISWLSTKKGLVNIDYSFEDIDQNGVQNNSTGIRWFVDQGDSTNSLASGVINEGDNGTGIVGLRNITVDEGDRINFVVDPDTNYTFDSTGFTAFIKYIEN